VSSTAAEVLDPAEELHNKTFSICGIHKYSRFNLPTIVKKEYQQDATI